MRYLLKNSLASAEIDSLGAELKSFSTADGTEYLWQGDSLTWEGQAPVLFPMVGGLRNGKATISGREFAMERHGFARKCEFLVDQSSENVITFSITDSDETLKKYPFKFKFTVTFSLSGKILTNTFNIKNLGNEKMPFAVGGHPAFRCPINDGVFEDFFIEFSEKEVAKTPFVSMETGLIDFNKRTPILENSKKIPLNHDLFENDALIFDQLESTKVYLKNSKNQGVFMDFKGFPFLGIWTCFRAAPFIALEPWTGCATGVDESDEFEKKRGMYQLNPSEEKTFKFSIGIL